jgi:hypothetical protein
MQRKAAGTAIAAVLGLALVQAIPAEASTPTDLGAILAPAPSSDYIEPLPSSSIYLEGSFDAQRFARWVTAINRSDMSALATDLKTYGFTRGYARSWLMPGKDYLLEEFVFEFDADAGATRWLRQEGSDTLLMKEYRGPLPGASALPFGWTARVSIDGPNGADRVGFASGNDVYEISFESTMDDLTALALKQGQAQYSLAPARSVPPAASQAISAPSGVPFLPVLTAIRWMGMALAAVIAAMTGLALLLIARRRV